MSYTPDIFETPDSRRLTAGHDGATVFTFYSGPDKADKMQPGWIVAKGVEIDVPAEAMFVSCRAATPGEANALTPGDRFLTLSETRRPMRSGTLDNGQATEMLADIKARDTAVRADGIDPVTFALTTDIAHRVSASLLDMGVAVEPSTMRPAILQALQEAQPALIKALPPEQMEELAKRLAAAPARALVIEHAPTVGKLAGYLTYDEKGEDEEFMRSSLGDADFAAGCTQRAVYFAPGDTGKGAWEGPAYEHGITWGADPLETAADALKAAIRHINEHAIVSPQAASLYRAWETYLRETLDRANAGKDRHPVWGRFTVIPNWIDPDGGCEEPVAFLYINNETQTAILAATRWPENRQGTRFRCYPLYTRKDDSLTLLYDPAAPMSDEDRSRF